VVLEVQVSDMTVYLPMWIFWLLTVIGTLIGLYIIILIVMYIWVGRKMTQFFNDVDKEAPPPR
jgi:hypothetical protein